jgi:hypothetical protein
MRIFRPLLCPCLALLACTAASAQTTGQTSRAGARPERPYRGVFAGGGDDSGQSLTGSASVSGGYDDNLLADATQQSQVFRQGQQGKLGQVGGSLNYSFTGERGSLEAGAGASLRYYPSLDDKYFDTYNANVSGEWVATIKPRLVLNQSVGYQPFTFMSDLAGPQFVGPTTGVPVIEPLVPPDVDFIPISSQYFVYDGGADLDVPVTRRTTITTGYSYHVADRTERRTWRQYGSLGTTFALNRDLSMHVMYRYTEAHYPTRIVRTHSPNVGLDFHHALSLTRRTSLTFGVGTEGYVVRDRTNFRLTGNVDVTHEIGRSWSATGSYQRGTYFSDTVDEPIFGDSGSLSLSGLISRRIQFDAGAHATIGNSGFSQQQNRFDSYRGTVTLSTALNRYMNIGLDYAYYRYNIGQAINLEEGLPNIVNRQSIRAHLSFWAPIISKARRTDATR